MNVCGYCEFADHCGKCACCTELKPDPIVAAVLAVTPIWDGEVLVDVQDETDIGGGYAEPLYGDPAPIAAKQAAAVLRFAATLVRGYGSTAKAAAFLCDYAAELDPSKGNSDAA